MLSFKAPPKKMLPLIFLIDVSDSMKINRRMESVNNAMVESLEALQDKLADNEDANLYLNALIFGGLQEPVRWMYKDMTPLNAFTWQNLVHEGTTPLDRALLELDTKLSSSAFMKSPSGLLAPVLILITDGVPDSYGRTDRALERLRTNNWFVHAQRMAIGVGMGAMDQKYLKEFIDGSESGEMVTVIDEARELMEKIQLITINSTMVGATRLRNVAPAPSPGGNGSTSPAPVSPPQPVPAPPVPTPTTSEEEEDDDKFVTEP